MYSLNSVNCGMESVKDLKKHGRHLDNGEDLPNLESHHLVDYYFYKAHKFILFKKLLI